MQKHLRLLLAFGLAVLVTVALAACNGNGTTKNAGTVAPAGPVKVGELLITMNGVKYDQLDRLQATAPPNSYLVIDYTVQNIGTEAQKFDSIKQFTLTDTHGQQYSPVRFVTDVIFPNMGIGGSAQYEVTTAIHHFTLAFEVHPMSGDQTRWNIDIQ